LVLLYPAHWGFTSWLNLVYDRLCLPILIFDDYGH
jgi:hypothetical protein